MLLPVRVDEYVREDNPVRAIDVYVESLELDRLGFKHATGELTAGQPPFAPQALLKLYLYGFLQGVRSSRKLAQECQRNLEVIWLMEGLQPGYKTIANFRKDNLAAIKATNKDFVELCQELELYGKELVAIDGAFFRGNVGKKSIYTQKRLQKSLRRLEKLIEIHLAEMDQADEAEEVAEGDENVKLAEKLEKLKAGQKKSQERLTKLQESGEKQLAEVDPDARLLTKNGQSLAGYNVQIAVDDKYKLIVSCAVTQDGNDTEQLAPMAKQARMALGVQHLEVVSDAGYDNFGQIKACMDSEITPYVPEPDKHAHSRKQGKFIRTDFHYQADGDAYLCPAGQSLSHYSQCVQRGLLRQAYRSQPDICANCPLKSHCLPAKSRFRSLYRWEHEEVIEAHRQRMAEKGRAMMAKRACLSEHPFGTVKTWCGWRHFLLRGLPKVGAEMEFWMLAYNFKRVLSILGLVKLRAYCSKRIEKRLQTVGFTPHFCFLERFWRLISAHGAAPANCQVFPLIPVPYS
jgi:transposase